MKKLWKRITAALAGTVLSAMAVMAPAVTALAKTGSQSEALEEFSVYDSDGNMIIDEEYAITATYTGSGTPYWISIYQGAIDGKDLLYFHWDQDNVPDETVTVTVDFKGLYTINSALTPYSDDKYGSSVTFVSASATGNTITMSFIPKNINSCNYVYYLLGTTKSSVGDWLEPLRTQLRIAADPEFGGNINHTAEYTGDFALPVEIMQYLKAHPDTTLKYSFYVNDVLQTVTISGKDVVIEEGVDWYGFSYLLRQYGNGTTGTGGYTIAAGDTLTSLAKKFGTTVQALAAKNGIKNVDLIYAGSKIAY